MVDFHDNSRDEQGSPESPDPMKYAVEPEQGYEPHPLFPRDDGSAEHRDIQFVSFRRRRTDGRIDNCPEDIPAGQIHSWATVVGPWGGGEYKAIGKDRNHRVVAWYPEKHGEWLLFDSDSKPFTLRDQRYAHSPPIAAPAAAPAPALAAVPAPIAPPPPAPPASSPVDSVMREVLLELREMRAARVAVPAPAPAHSANDLALVEMIKSQGELLRTVLTQRPVEAVSRTNNDPMAMTLQILAAFQKFGPQPQPQASVADRLGEYRAIRELTTPTAPPAPQSEFGEIKDLVMSVMQAGALTQATRDVPVLPPVLERRPPSPPPRPPPPPPPPPPAPPRPRQYVTGLGWVEVVQAEEPPRRTEAPPLRTEAPPRRSEAPPLRTEAPPPRIPDLDVDFATLPRDPAQRQRRVVALEIESTASTAAPSTPVPLPEVPALELPNFHAVFEPAPEVSVVVASPTTDEVFDAAWDLTPDVERSPIEALPTAPFEVPLTAPFEVPPTVPFEVPPTAPFEVPLTAPFAADDLPPIELHEQTPRVVPNATTAAEQQRARGSLARLARMPRDQLRAVLCTLPGIGPNVDATMRAATDLPPEAWPFLVANLPADVVRALAAEPGD